MNKTYCGYDWNSLNSALNTLSKLEDGVLMTDAEHDAMDVAIQCVCSALNLLQGYPVVLDGDMDEQH